VRIRFPFLEAGVAMLLLPGGVHGAVDHGEIRLDQLSCTACHAAPPQAEGRFPVVEGPRLGSQGLRLTPQWLRAFLAAPDVVHPGTSMPDMLHAMAPEEKGRAIEDLTQYLVSREGPADPAFDCPPGLIEKGQELYDTVGCVACHAPRTLLPRLADDAQALAEFKALQANTQPFTDLARMTSVPQMAAFLRDPVRFHPAGRMPSMKLSGTPRRRRSRLTSSREQEPAGVNGEANGAGGAYEYFERRFGNCRTSTGSRAGCAGSVPTFRSLAAVAGR
jgi:mono/diheme cytochrome c family protein